MYQEHISVIEYNTNALKGRKKFNETEEENVYSAYLQVSVQQSKHVKPNFA